MCPPETYGAADAIWWMLVTKANDSVYINRVMRDCRAFSGGLAGLK